MDQYSEKRREPRVYNWMPITIEVSGVCFLYRARLANHSGRGLYFETDLFINPGSKICIGIQDSSHRFFPKDYGSFLVKIIWRKCLNDISFKFGYGAKMVFNQVQKKSQRNDHFEPQELRKHPRKSFSKPAYFSSQNKYYGGLIKNISHGGAFIETKTKFSNGDELKLVVPGPNKYILIKCKIIHFNQAGFGLKFKNVSKIQKISRTKKYNRQLAV